MDHEIIYDIVMKSHLRPVVTLLKGPFSRSPVSRCFGSKVVIQVQNSWSTLTNLK